MEAQAQAELAARRFRKARDLFKLLCKEDRAKFLPGLIAANRGLAEDLMAKGQVPEAEQVIAYLKTIMPAGELLGMDVRAAQHAQDWTKALRLAAEWWTTTNGELAPGDRTTAADTLVLAFPNPETVGASIPEALRADLAGILAALRALSEGRLAEAQDALRPIPRGSLFADWKMFVKAWLAFHAGDRARALQQLEAVPLDSAPGRAANALRPFLGSVNLPVSPSLGLTCRFLGEPALAPILARADQLWDAGQHFASWQEMRRANGFPSELPGLYGALSDFYFRVHATLHGDAAGRYVVGGLCKFANQGVFKSAAEQRLIARTLGSDALANGVLDAAEDWWRELVGACPPDDPRTAKLAALVFAHVGHWMAQPYDLDPLHELVDIWGLRSVDGAMRNLEKSIRYDPQHLPPYLDLLKVYAIVRQTRERKQLLEAMIKRFPDDKAVLLEAGRDKLERGAFPKALDLLKRAYALDRLDPATQCELVRGHLLLARQQFQKNAFAAARQTLAHMEEYAVRDGIDFERGLDLLRARGAGLEAAFGEEAAARAARRRAGDDAHPGGAVAARARGLPRRRGHPPRQGPFWKELKGLVAGTPAERALLVQALDHAFTQNEMLDWKPEVTFVRDSLAPVAGAAFTRDEASQLHRQLSGRPGFEKLVKDLVRTALRQDPKDPRFLLLKELSMNRRDGWIDRYKIGHLRDEAARRGDQQAVTLASEVLNRPPPGFDEEDDDFDDFDIPFGADLGPIEIPGLPPDPSDLAASFGLDPREVANMKRMADSMSDHEFATFRKKSAKMIPMAIFDLLIGTRDPAPKPKRRDTSQMDLF